MKVNRVGGKACGSSVPPSFRGLFSYGGASVTVELGGGGGAEASLGRFSRTASVSS